MLENTLESPLRRPNQSILKETNPEHSLEGLMLKVKLQYFSYLMQRVNLLEKTLMLGETEGRRRREQQRMRWLDGITDSVDTWNVSELWETVKGRGSWRTAIQIHEDTESGRSPATEQPGNQGCL